MCSYKARVMYVCRYMSLRIMRRISLSICINDIHSNIHVSKPLGLVVSSKIMEPTEMVATLIIYMNGPLVIFGGEPGVWFALYSRIYVSGSSLTGPITSPNPTAFHGARPFRTGRMLVPWGQGASSFERDERFRALRLKLQGAVVWACHQPLVVNDQTIHEYSKSGKIENADWRGHHILEKLYPKTVSIYSHWSCIGLSRARTEQECDPCPQKGHGGISDFLWPRRTLRWMQCQRQPLAMAWNGVD